MTLDHADPALFDLVPDLAALCPPAGVFDKTTYSPWATSGFDQVMSRPDDTALVITGAETDVCVLAAILGAVDRGYCVIVPTDAICSSSDTTHDALLTLYRQRFAEQIETASADEVLAAWA